MVKDGIISVKTYWIFELYRGGRNIIILTKLSVRNVNVCGDTIDSLIYLSF